MTYDLKKEGKIHIITGFGKYKSSGAFGTALRAINQDWRILVVQFLKAEYSGEIEVFRKYFDKQVTVLQFGIDKIALPCNVDIQDEHEASRGWEYMIEELTEGKKSTKVDSQKSMHTPYDLLILDEVLPAIELKLLSQSQLFDFLKNKQKDLEVICTGRVKDKVFMDNLTYISHLHSDIVCKRHYFSCKCPDCSRSWEYHYTYCPNCSSKLERYTRARLGIEI